MLEKNLYCWYLGNPEHPVPVGNVQLEISMRRCILITDPSWSRSGFNLTPDMSREQRIHIPAGNLRVPGAIDDAMPDRWGERMIRVIPNPSRMSPLDLLWYTGDRRFGALGISSSKDAYIPYEYPPLIHASSISEAESIIQRVLERDPLNKMERQLIASSVSLGGAHPKMLVEHEGEEWIAKFPCGSNVDQLLIEHASMVLARRAGINVAYSDVMLKEISHILLVKRFDRIDTRHGPVEHGNSEHGNSEQESVEHGHAGRGHTERRHAVSVRTMLAGQEDDSYAAISGLLRKYGAVDRIKSGQIDLFRRMAFNIMFDNTDDHTKNHAFLRNNDGTWELSPTYDIPTQMNGLGQQAIQISADPLQRGKFDRNHAVSSAADFGMEQDQALEEWNRVAGHIDLWREVFVDCGVMSTDIDYLCQFLEQDQMKAHRVDAIKPSGIGHDTESRFE